MTNSKGRSAKMKVTLGIAAIASLALLAAVSPSAASASGCGTVTTVDHVKYRVTSTKGSPSCSVVRGVVKEYGHPKAVRSTCHPASHLCMYGVYANGWRCTGLFQGNFGCWLGGDAKGNNARQSFSAKNVY
jgi:hypothetical protein